MRTLLIFPLLLTGLVLVGCAESAPDHEDEPGESLEAGPAPGFSGKADEAAIPIRHLEYLVPDRLLETELRRTITTENAFRRVFGTASPSIHWDRQWVIFYTTGALDGPGHEASIASVRPAESGRSLQVVTRHSISEPECARENERAAPYALVTIPRPEVDPRAIRYFAEEEQVLCRPAECDPVPALLQASDDLYFMSEGDYPFTPAYSTATSFEEFEAMLVLEEFDEFEVVDYQRYMEFLMEVPPWAGEDAPFFEEQASKYRQLDAAFEEHLTDMRIYRAGWIEVHLIFVGVSACGEILGLRTISIET